MLVIARELFDGDIDAWERYLVDHGTSQQKLRDLPCLHALRRLVRGDRRLDALLREPAALLPN